MAALKSLVPADWLPKRDGVRVAVVSSGNAAFHGTVRHTVVVVRTVTLLQSHVEYNGFSYAKSYELNQIIECIG